MKVFDSLKNKKWIGRGFDLKEESILILKSANLSHPIPLEAGEYKLKLIGKKRTGSGTLFLEILTDDQDVFLRKKIDFSSPSWSEHSFSFTVSQNVGFAKIKLTREKNIYGSVELGRIYLDVEADPIIKRPIVSRFEKRSKVKKNVLTPATIPELKKIAFIVPYRIYGGAEVYLKNLISEIDDQFQISIIYLQENFLQNQLSNVQHRVIKNLDQLRGILKSINFDFVVFYNRADIYWLLLELKKENLNFAKIIEIYHSDFVWSGSLSSIKARQNLDLFLAVSPSIGQGIKGIEKRELLPVGIDIEKFQKEKYQNREYKKFQGVIGTVARLSKEKRIDYIIALARIMPEYQFVIIGDGPEEQILNKQIKQFELNNVKLLGFQNDVAEHYAYFDAFVLASRMEGTPISILEAMASSTPVFSNMVGAIPDILKDGETGFKITEDPKIDAEIIRKQIGNSEVIKNARDYVEQHHSIIKNAEKFKKILLSDFEFYVNKDPDSILLPGGYV